MSLYVMTPVYSVHIIPSNEVGTRRNYLGVCTPEDVEWMCLGVCVCAAWAWTRVLAVQMQID